MDWFEGRFAASLTTIRFGQRFRYLQRVNSTNRYARMLVRKGAPEGTLVMAEQQTLGRGRFHHRVWESPYGRGLWISLVLRPAISRQSLASLTFLAASALVETLKRDYQLQTQVKWPNDLMWQNRKWAGILAETVNCASGRPAVILGMGINVNQRREDFSPDLQSRAVSLRMALGRRLPRFPLLHRLLSQLEEDYLHISDNGFQSVLRRWIDASAVIGKEIAFELPDRRIRGRVRGFHSNGDIVILTEGGRIERFSNGRIIEVHHAAGC